MRSGNCQAVHYSEHAERVNPKNSVWPGSGAIPAWSVGHCWGCIQHRQLKGTEVYKPAWNGKSPQDQPKGSVMDTSGKGNVAELLCILLEH